MSTSAMASEGLAAYRGLKKEGRLGEGLLALRRALADGAGTPQAVQMIGRALAGDLPAEGATEVLLLGQCTTSYLPPFLLAWSWADGVALKVREGEYDNVVQDLAALTTKPEVVILLPWHQRLLAEQVRSVAQRVNDELVWLRAAWARIAALGAKLVQVTYDWTQPGPAGYALAGRTEGGAIALVRAMNEAVRAELPSGAFLVELEHISANCGHRQFYDARNYGWAKQPFTPAGLNELGRHLAAGVRAVCRGRRKVLVLDLDNTLWGGVVGETGPHGIVLGGGAEGEAYLAFQHFVRGLRTCGVVLAVCSKNNDADAREPFLVNTQMALKLEDFAAFHATWEPKPDRLRRIAEELRLGLDSFVFFDDNPVERDHVRQVLPEVLVVEAPADPAGYVGALQDALAFEAVEISTADAQRGAQYQAETVRAGEQANFGTLEEYLGSLEMRAKVEPIGPENLGRVVELLAKTNQFNLTSRRHSRAEVERLLALPGAIGLALSLVDRFGDYGLISVVIAVPEEGEPAVWRVDTWLMSCRAIGRTVEHFMGNCLAAATAAVGATGLIGEFFATAKNQKVASLYSDFQFTEVPGQPGRFRRALADWTPLATAVKAH